MSALREKVESIYEHLKKMWTRKEFALSLKERRAPISLQYVTSAILLNFKIFIEKRGNVGSYFEFFSPVLTEYINE